MCYFFLLLNDHFVLTQISEAINPFFYLSLHLFTFMLLNLLLHSLHVPLDKSISKMIHT